MPMNIAMTVPTLLSVSELKEQLGGPVILDGSWHMPAEKRDPIQEFKNEHLPGGSYFVTLTLINSQ